MNAQFTGCCFPNENIAISPKQILMNSTRSLISCETNNNLMIRDFPINKDNN